MAGSWDHMVDEAGVLLDSERFAEQIETVGDVFEAAEECYGMVLWLAQQLSEQIDAPRDALIEEAQLNYRRGVRLGGAVPFGEV